MRQEYHRTGTTDAGANKQREILEVAVKRVNNDIIHAPCQAIAKVPHLAHCKDIQAIKTNMKYFGELSDVQLDNPNLLTLTDLIQDIFKHMRQGSTKRSTYKNIFAPPYPMMSLAQQETKLNIAFDHKLM